MSKIKHKGMTLVHEASLRPVLVGERIKDFRGDVCVIAGGAAPIAPPSSGRVHFADGREYYPSVVDCKWMPDQDVPQFH